LETKNGEATQTRSRLNRLAANGLEGAG